MGRLGTGEKGISKTTVMLVLLLMLLSFSKWLLLRSLWKMLL